MDFNQQIIDTFRTNGGVVEQPPFGDGLVLVHVPKKDGGVRVTPLAAVQHDGARSEEHTSELQSREKLVCRLLLEKKKNNRAKPDSNEQQPQLKQRARG